MNLSRSNRLPKWRWSLVVAGIVALACASAWLLGPKGLTVTFLRVEDGDFGKRWAVWRLGNATGEVIFCQPGVYQAQSPDGWKDYPIPSEHINVNSGTDWDVSTSLGTFDGLDPRITRFRVSFIERRQPPRWIRTLAKKAPWLVPAKVLQTRVVSVWSEVVAL